MPESIFSTYQGGENRITSAILAVFRSISIELTESILTGLLGEDIKLVDFKNQSTISSNSVPDGAILYNVNILIETKIYRKAVRRDQLEKHLNGLKENESNFLLVLTPDAEEPHIIQRLQDDRVRWASFGDFDQLLAEILSNSEHFVQERDEFLLRNLGWLFLDPRLDILPRNDVCIVAARRAWPQYQSTGFYHCPTTYTFRSVEYFGFYADQAIQPKIAKVTERYDNIVFDSKFVHDDRRLREYVTGQVQGGRVPEGESRQVIKLSEYESSETIVVNDGQPISHNQRGRGRGFTRSKRYVALEKIRGARTTDDIID